MKNNTMTILKKELARFFGDKRMVFTTVLLPGLMIYVVYSFMGQGIMQQFMTSDAYEGHAYVVNQPTEIWDQMESLSAEWETIDGAQTDEVKTMIQDKEADVLVVFPEDFVNKVETYEVSSHEPAPAVEIYYNSTESESEKLYREIADICDSYEASLANKLDINPGEGNYDCASEQDVTGQLFAMLLPMLLMIFLYSGCISVAPEAIAGEKERGTIATLLVTPMKRSSLALGKILSLSLIALLSGLSSFVGTMISLPKLMGGEMTGIDSAVYQVSDYAMLLGVILSTVLVLVALISIISAFARSIKEAGTAVSPLMIVIMFVSLTPMFGGDGEKALLWFLVPIYNSVLCMHGIFSFAYEPMQVLVTIAVNIVTTGLLTFVLTQLFNSEKVMFSN